MAHAHPLEQQEKLEDAFSATASSDAKTAIADLAHQFAIISDKDFLSQFALAACRTLNADYFLIGRLNPFSNIMRTVQLVSGGALTENINYSLDGTPCARVLDNTTCVYSDNVDAQFPHDKLLKEMNVKGYVGAPLFSSSGEALGVVAGLTKKTIEDENFARAIIDHFRDRLAVALETEEILDRYSWVIAEASDGIWDWDVITGGTTVSKRIQVLQGYDAGEGPYDLMQIEKAVHPDDRKIQVEALQNHLNSGTTYDIKIRLRDKNGVYRWFRSRGKAIRNEAGKPIRMIGCFSDIHELMMEAKPTGCRT